MKTTISVNNSLNKIFFNDMKLISLYKIKNLPKTNEKNVSNFKSNMLIQQKILINIVLVLIFSVFVNAEAKSQSTSKQEIRTVVIDAGHGGSDPGAVGKYSKEKDLALAISLKFGELIEKNFDDVKVIYTRTDDSFVELYKRAKIANDNNADLFVCIHINAISGANAYGAETFVMGLHKNNANLQVAKLENSVILKEDNYEAQYEGFDPNDPENHIVFSLYQNANLAQSLLFADDIQKNFTGDLKRHDRGVKQAGFLVLWKTTMPAVLIECGFISNPTEEAYLNSKDGQNGFATAIFDAFVSFKDNYEDNVGSTQTYNTNLDTENSNSNTTESDTNNTETEVANTVETTNSNAENTSNTSEVEAVETGIVFKVQVKISSKKIELIPENFNSYQNLDVYLHNGVYKYTIGSEANYSEILELQNSLRKDFADCFVVAFKDGQRIPLNQARSESKNR